MYVGTSPDGNSLKLSLMGSSRQSDEERSKHSVLPMAPWVKGLATKSDSLSLISRICTVEGEK